MSSKTANITLPVNLTNPGQFFACCGLLELADRLWPGAEGWFDSEHFYVASEGELNLSELLRTIAQLSVANTMHPSQVARLEELSALSKRSKKDLTSQMESEKKALESQRREEPIFLAGPVPFRIDWFRDEFAGGSRFKTWAGQQSVLDIARSMHAGLAVIGEDNESSLFDSAREIGLPFNFDSDLGGQGSALDIGFSFDPLAGSEATRIAGACRPALEFLCFVGLQRFRPREHAGQNRFIFSAWTSPLPPSIAHAVVSQSIPTAKEVSFEFRLLYRTKYLKSFLPAIPFQGDIDDFN